MGRTNLVLTTNLLKKIPFFPSNIKKIGFLFFGIQRLFKYDKCKLRFHDFE